MENLKEAVEDLRDKVSAIRKQGAQIDLEKLEDALNNAIEIQDGSSPEHGKALVLENIKARHSFNIESVRGVFMFAVESIKAALLVNGGAAVAVLSFLAQQERGARRVMMSGLASAGLLSFALGVFCAAVAAGFCYFAQDGFSDDDQPRFLRNKRAAVVLIFMSYSGFLVGAIFLFAYFQ